MASPFFRVNVTQVPEEAWPGVEGSVSAMTFGLFVGVLMTGMLVVGMAALAFWFCCSSRSQATPYANEEGSPRWKVEVKPLCDFSFTLAALGKKADVC